MVRYDVSGQQATFAAIAANYAQQGITIEYFRCEQQVPELTFTGELTGQDEERVDVIEWSASDGGHYHLLGNDYDDVCVASFDRVVGIGRGDAQ